jgi:O-antigen ligase
MGTSETLLLVALALLALVVIWTYRNGRMCLTFLVGATAGLVGIQVFRVHLFTIVVLAWVLYRGGLVNTTGLRRALLMIIPIGSLAITSLIGDLVNSDTLVLQLLALSASAALVMIFSTEADRRHMLGGLLATTTISSLVALLQVVKIIPIETWHLSVSSLGRPIGLYPEPDWLGMFAGIGMVMAWRMPIGKWTRTAAVTINAAAFILAFARAAWIAVAVAVALTVLVGWFADRRRPMTRARGRGGAVFLLSIAAACVLLFMPQLVGDLSTRLGGTLQAKSEDVSAQARVRQIDGLLRLADMAPFYGHGLSSAGRVGVWGDVDLTSEVENNVATNWVLGLWVDGKYLAIPLIALLVLTALRNCRTIQGQALVVVLVSSIFSNATFSPEMWLLLGLCLAEPKAIRERVERAKKNWDAPLQTWMPRPGDAARKATLSATPLVSAQGATATTPEQ